MQIKIHKDKTKYFSLNQVYSAANAQIPEIKEINDWDNVAITLKFNSGTIGMIDLCRFANYGYDQVGDFLKIIFFSKELKES